MNSNIKYFLVKLLFRMPFKSNIIKHNKLGNFNRRVLLSSADYMLNKKNNRMTSTQREKEEIRILRRYLNLEEGEEKNKKMSSSMPLGSGCSVQIPQVSK